jgi:uncharacterized protein YceH (UPF0502 family)
VAGSHLFQDEVFLSCGTQVAELDLDRGQQQARTEIRWMTRKVLFENDRHVAQIARRGGQRDERVQRFFASRIGDQASSYQSHAASELPKAVWISASFRIA